MLKKLLSLLSDAAVYGASSLLGQFINFLLLPVYMWYIDPRANGEFLMITNVMAYFTPLTNLGMINAVFRRFNVEKDDRQRGAVLSTGLCSIAITSCVALVLGLIFATSLARFALGTETAIAEGDVTFLVRVALVSFAASTVGAMPLAVLRADRRVKTVALVNLTRTLLTIGSTMALIVVAGWGVRGVFVGQLLGELVCTTGLFAMTARSFRYAPNLATWKKMASYGLPFVPHQLQGMTMEVIPSQAVGYMLGLAEAGVYGIAMKFAMPVTFIVNSVQAAWVPYKFQVHADDENPAEVFRTIITYYIAAILYLWVGVSLWGPELVWLMGQENYYPAAALVPFAALVPVSRGIYFMLGTGMELSDDTRPFPLVTAAGLVTAAISALVLIPRFGVAGGAIAAANSFIALTVVIYYFSQKRFAIRYDFSTLFTLVALAVAAVALGFARLNQPLAVRLSLAVIISLAFPLVEFAVLLRSSTERHRMRRLWATVTRREKKTIEVEPAAAQDAVGQVG